MARKTRFFFAYFYSDFWFNFDIIQHLWAIENFFLSKKKEKERKNCTRFFWSKLSFFNNLFILSTQYFGCALIKAEIIRCSKFRVEVKKAEEKKDIDLLNIILLIKVGKFTLSVTFETVNISGGGGQICCLFRSTLKVNHWYFAKTLVECRASKKKK